MLRKLVLAVALSLLFFCGAIGVLLVAYCWLISYDSLHEMRRQRPLEHNAKPPKQQGLSEADLQRLPTVEYHDEEGKERPSGSCNAECAVCLEPFQSGQRCRVIPACSHAFHVQCADAWLSRRSVCPICRRSVACESDEKNGVNGGATATLQEDEVRDEESGRSYPPPTAESVVVDMSVA
jgi:hypothetical protein